MIQPTHLALILFVVLSWGLSFVVIRVGLHGVPPLLLAALRFLFAAFPVMLILPRPKVDWRALAGYGIATGVIQFGLLFVAMRVGISAGLASLVIQTQVFFTVLLSSLLFGERMGSHQWSGLVVAFLGIGLIAASSDASATIPALLMTLGAALGWAAANLIVRYISSRPQPEPINMLAFVVHSSLYATVPLFVLAFVLDGPQPVLDAVTRFSLVSAGSVAFLALVATVACFGAWAWLIGRYGAARIAPFALLVPVSGMVSSAFLLQESFAPLKLLAAGLVVLGLLINVFGARWLAARRLA